ncbi:hypothetical protein [Streptomyces erythrochromogenes]|uniref:hypothetical protein n=1 Tax=Streptomyces erythrochromogenes TaxID=285574 RepID=UPI0022550089|nr:hypothetical protein [Streptomyces erythrochromogenes]MCX5587581.1 hypothetical protein [Streptomyces erythrochromogenes]
MSSRDPSNLAARNLIAERLITRHNLDPLEAHTAVTRVHLGLPTEHDPLVRQEAQAIIDEFQQQLTEAFAPLAAAMRTFAENLARTLEQLPPSPGRGNQPRPAWQSPYGPPRKGHRR